MAVPFLVIDTRGPCISWFHNLWSPLFHDYFQTLILFISHNILHDFEVKKSWTKFFFNSKFPSFHLLNIAVKTFFFILLNLSIVREIQICILSFSQKSWKLCQIWSKSGLLIFLNHLEILVHKGIHDPCISWMQGSWITHRTKNHEIQGSLYIQLLIHIFWLNVFQSFILYHNNINGLELILFSPLQTAI